MDRRTFITGLGAVAAAPVLPTLGEGIIGIDFETVSGLYPYQRVVVAFLDANAGGLWTHQLGWQRR